MSTGGVKESVLAKVYAGAMLKLARSSGHADALGEELESFAGLVASNAEFGAVLDSPTVNASTRQRMIEKLFRGKFGDVLVDSLQVLNRNERLFLSEAVAEEYHQLLEEANGRVEVQVRSASPLTDPLRARLREVLAKATGRHVDLIEKIDESLIGGMVVQVGDDKYDSSVRRKLHTVGQLLMERASREIHRGAATAAP